MKGHLINKGQNLDYTRRHSWGHADPYKLKRNRK